MDEKEWNVKKTMSIRVLILAKEKESSELVHQLLDKLEWKER